MTGRPCSDLPPDAVQRAELAALETWRVAALLLGDETEALRLVESTVAAVDVDPCADPAAVKGLVRDRVLDGALALMHHQDPACFAEVPSGNTASSCLDEDSAPLSTEDLADLVSGSGRSRLRSWLDRLSQAQRAVFVQRAVLGRSNADTARAINRFARPSVWTPDAVGRLFREALCSLASALAHTATVHGW